MARKRFCPLCKQMVGLRNDLTLFSHTRPLPKAPKIKEACSGSHVTVEQANKIYNDRLQRRDIWEGF